MADKPGKDKPLKQDEIDALFQAAQGTPPASVSGSANASAPAAEAPAAPKRRVQPYNFARAGQISNDQMRAISLLNDIFARNLTHYLSVWLRSPFQVTLVSAEQIPFNEFIARIPDLSYVCSVRLEPLRAISVLMMEMTPAPPIIDLLLGGQGAAGQMRELTDIEEAILASVIEIICREMSAAWEPVGLSFHYEQRQMQTQIAHLMPVSEKTLCLNFEVKLEAAAGLMNIAFPAVVSNTILHRMVGDWTRQRSHNPEIRARLRHSLGKARIGAALQLPAFRVPTRQIEGLEAASTLRFPLSATVRPQMRVSGVPLFEAMPVRYGEHRGAQLGQRKAP
ncbi:flagellar motor switch protein FliM [Silvibacterium sp.]|uniref:flagellar motor switch protein FliM n=1 Tax=Silvibacterium sp. TaxID=1964179 RepID=UPI0039E2B72A